MPSGGLALSKRSESNGFTLMELLIVIAILGILITVGLGSFQSSQTKSRDTKRKNDLRQISVSLEAYYNDKQSYPLSDVNGAMLGCGTNAAATCVWGQIWSNTSVTPNTIYMEQIPKDPSPLYKYYYVSDGKYYQLYAKMENTLDTGTGVNQTGYTGTNCAASGTKVCTYGISSPNTKP